MTESALLPVNASQSEATCASHLGAYYLSKTYLKITVEQVKTKTKGIEKTHNEIKELIEVRKPDRTQGYCLDYIASPTAKEKVQVVRNRDFLFNYISTESLDQSAYILRTLIRALFVGLSGNKDFQPFRADPVMTRSIVFEAEFDPFDVKQSAMINEALTPYQLCLVLENHTFDPRRHSINSYCNNPKSVIRRQGVPEQVANGRMGMRKEARGIVYRPRLPYNLYAFMRPRGRGEEWSLAATEIVHLENEAPNLVIGVERAFFANRRATLLFDEGALKNVCIHKTSELEQLTTVPLEIAGSIAALPTNMLQVRINNTTTHKELVDAERQLIATQTKHAEFLADPTKITPAPAKSKTEASTWTPLPDGAMPSDIQETGFAGTWDICPALTTAKTTALAGTASFID